MRLNDGRALPAFMSQALEGRPLTVFGDGSQTRSFCYVDDLIEGIWRLLHSNEVLPVNIGNPNEMNILEFARKVLEITGARASIVHHPLPTDDPRVRQPNIEKARRILGWEPRVGLDEGLRRTLAYFQGRVRRKGEPSSV
jgi:dTDP-glucose 4,6-dehydratase